MRVWEWILAAAALSYLTKLCGYLVRGDVLQRPRVQRSAEAVTIGLLAALVVSNVVAGPSGLVLDSRAFGLGIAAMALAFRAPFLLVVVLGAAATALARWAMTMM